MYLNESRGEGATRMSADYSMPQKNETMNVAMKGGASTHQSDEKSLRTLTPRICLNVFPVSSIFLFFFLSPRSSQGKNINISSRL